MGEKTEIYETTHPKLFGLDMQDGEAVNKRLDEMKRDQN